MRVYLAARYSLNGAMREAAAYLSARGHVITSRWINGCHELGDHPTDEARRRLAFEDLDDLRIADAMIAFSEPPRTMSNSRGGRHVEFGLAIALNKQILVIGLRENVFHYLPDIRHFSNLVDAAQALDEAPRVSAT